MQKTKADFRVGERCYLIRIAAERKGQLPIATIIEGAIGGNGFKDFVGFVRKGRMVGLSVRPERLARTYDEAKAMIADYAATRIAELETEIESIRNSVEAL